VDIYLYRVASKFDIVLSKGLRALLHNRRGWLVEEKPQEEPVVAGSLFTSLVEQYGSTMGLQVFQKMYAERKGPFQEGAKYDPEKPSVVRKVATAGGVVPNQEVRLLNLLVKKLRR
jgi:hypothetical protein